MIRPLLQTSSPLRLTTTQSEPILNVELKTKDKPRFWLLLSFHKHALRVPEAPDQVCESSHFRPRRSPNCVIFCGAHTPSLARPASADSITMGAEMAAAVWVVPSLNSNLLLTPGLESKKKSRQVSGKHSLKSRLKSFVHFAMKPSVKQAFKQDKKWGK